MARRIDRRAVLKQGAAAVAASAMSAAPAMAQKGVGRQSIGVLSPNDPMIESYRTAVRAMKALPESDPRNWRRMAQIHVDFCPHGNWYFLPWHRAYLLSFERICGQLSGNANFALPFWDWTTDRTLPASFSAPEWNGQPNPLHDRTRRLSPTTPLPADMVGSPLIEFILAEPNFEPFGSLRPTGQNDTAADWQTRPGTKGLLESNPHDRLHVRLGGSADPPGTMSTMMSPLDPIFWLHHCNVDRLWDRWNWMEHQNSNSPLWRNFAFRGQFAVPSGQGTTPFNPVVSKLLNLDDLGYHYVSPAVMMARTDSVSIPRAFKVEQLGTSARANVATAARTNVALETQIKLDEGRRRTPAGARRAGGQRAQDHCNHPRRRAAETRQCRSARVRKPRQSHGADSDQRSTLRRHVHVFRRRARGSPRQAIFPDRHHRRSGQCGASPVRHREHHQGAAAAGPDPGEPAQDVTFKPARIEVAVL